MLNPHVSLSNLYLTLNKQFGKGTWTDYEPETILFDEEEASPLLAEKIYALRALVGGFTTVMEMPEFILWLTAVCNNEEASFESIEHPTSLELAWMVKQVQLLSALLGHDFPATDAMKAVVAYFLVEDGYSEPVEPFTFVDRAELEPGQTEEDTAAKKKAVDWYIAKMKETSHA